MKVSKTCKWNCVKGYCLSHTADFDEHGCKFAVIVPAKQEEPKESQDDLWSEVEAFMMRTCTDFTELKERFTITRKP